MRRATRLERALTIREFLKKERTTAAADPRSPPELLGHLDRWNADNEREIARRRRQAQRRAKSGSSRAAAS